MNDLEKQLFTKSIESTNNAINMMSNLISKNENLQYEMLKDKIILESIKKNMEEISRDIKKNYPEDKAIILKLNKFLDDKEIKKASDTLRDIRLAMSLMKIIAANVSSFEGDPSLWYRYTDTIKKIENNIDYLT
jgi:hypothetical protein